MKTQHIIMFTRNQEVYQKLCALQFPVDEHFIIVKLYEDDARWPAVKELALEFKHVDSCRSSFSPTECRQADWIVVGPCWLWGYPKPDDDNGYMELTYDLTQYCTTCGIGIIQKAPFRVKSEPGWGTRNILQLNWVFDEYFVRPEIWEAVFKPFGIERYPVLHHRTGKELTTVVQLKILGELPAPLQITGYPYESLPASARISEILLSMLQVTGSPYQDCPVCHRRKFLPISCGRFPAMTLAPTGHAAVKSQEFFGSGSSANQKVFFSNALYRSCIEHQVKGVEYKPVGDGI